MFYVYGFLLPAYLHAQNNSYQFSHLDITNGLSDNQVNCIYKDEKGFMWFGTTSGLNRYDGISLKYLSAILKIQIRLPKTT
jgi:ligand-binding sensor domain-containing protein